LSGKYMNSSLSLELSSIMNLLNSITDKELLKEYVSAVAKKYTNEELTLLISFLKTVSSSKSKEG
jgi:hypothetical protein